MSAAIADVKERIDTIESCYEFFIAYAAQGLTTDEGAKSGGQLREFLGSLERALDGLADQLQVAVESVEPAEAWATMVSVVRADASATLAAIRLVSAQKGVSSQLIDNLNANMHLRAILTDGFLVDTLTDGLLADASAD